MSSIRLLLLVICVGSSACKSTELRKGRSAFEFLNPNGATERGAAQLKNAEEDRRWVNHIDPYAKTPLAKPIYPAKVLASGGESCTIFARVSIDEKGRVVDVSQSWTHVSTPTRNYELFFAAVRDAVESWNMEPAYDVHWERVNGEDRYVRTEATSTKVDVKFSFDVSGKVR